MAGLTEDGCVELYARTPALDEGDLVGLERICPAPTTVQGLPLRQVVRHLLAADGLPRPSGVSIVLDPDAQPRAVTWFCFAKAVWRDDRTAAAALRRWAGSDRSRAVFDALVGPIGVPARWRHAMVGVGTDAGGRTWVQAGLRPA
jgi:hypothetical protein